MKKEKTYRPRCEYFAEAGESKPGEPRCAAPVTTVIHMMVHGEPGALFACKYHAPMMAQEKGFISMEPAPWLEEIRLQRHACAPQEFNGWYRSPI
jgi:hypothetical protein